MITEAILSVLFQPVNFLFGSLVGLLPLATLPVDFVVGLETLFLYINWLMPLSALLPILLIKLSLEIFNIGWKLFLRFKSFIPTMGG